MTGGMLALPRASRRVGRSCARTPALLDCAVEEIVRWTTPVIQFARTATRDYPLRGKTIREGESVCLFYAVGQPRRGGLRRSVRLPHRSRSEPAHRLRHGRARLPRRASRPPRAAPRLRAAARAARARASWRARSSACARASSAGSSARRCAGGLPARSSAHRGGLSAGPRASADRSSPSAETRHARTTSASRGRRARCRHRD